MNALERIRPEPQTLDADWSTATLRHIFASGGPAPAPTRTPVRRRVVASVMAVAAVVVAVVVGSVTLGTSAAFAVEEDGNGDVVVTIHRLTDAAGLEEALREHGINAQVTYLRTQSPSDLDDGSSPSPCANGQTVGAGVDPSDDGGFTVTLQRAYLERHSNAEMSLTAAGGGSADDWSGVKIDWSDGLC